LRDQCLRELYCIEYIYGGPGFLAVGDTQKTEKERHLADARGEERVGEEPNQKPARKSSLALFVYGNHSIVSKDEDTVLE